MEWTTKVFVGWGFKKVFRLATVAMEEISVPGLLGVSFVKLLVLQIEIVFEHNKQVNQNVVNKFRAEIHLQIFKVFSPPGAPPDSLNFFLHEIQTRESIISPGKLKVQGSHRLPKASLRFARKFIKIHHCLLISPAVGGKCSRSSNHFEFFGFERGCVQALRRKRAN